MIPWFIANPKAYQLVWYPRSGTMNLTIYAIERVYIFSIRAWLPFFTWINCP